MSREHEAWELEKWDETPVKNEEFNPIDKDKEKAKKELPPASTTEKWKIDSLPEIHGEQYYANVYEPEHYKIFPDAEVIDLIKKCLTHEEFIGYCKGNILKYRLRDKHNNAEDFEKSKQYKEYLNDDALQRTKKP